MIFKNVDTEALANIYFDGKVTSHSFITQEGEKKNKKTLKSIGSDSKKEYIIIKI